MNSGIGLAAGGGLSLVASVVLNDQYLQAKEAYRTATANFNSLYSTTQSLYTATTATAITGYSCVGLGAILFVAGILTPEPPAGPKVQVGAIPTRDGFHVVAAFQF